MYRQGDTSMASHKFVYTVSGVDLTDAQKSKISHEIAGVVTRAVLGESRAQIQPELLTLNGIAGGRMIQATELASEKGRSVEDFISRGCGGGGEEF
jgi:hypothetical protein